MTKYDWLLLVHILGAFLFLSGSIVAGVLALAAMRREVPSEVALLLRLTRPVVVHGWAPQESPRRRGTR